jgi:hypothetical protein
MAGTTSCPSRFLRPLPSLVVGGEGFGKREQPALSLEGRDVIKFFEAYFKALPTSAAARKTAAGRRMQRKVLLPSSTAQRPRAASPFLI